MQMGKQSGKKMQDCHAHKSQPLVPIPLQMNTVNALPSYHNYVNYIHHIPLCIILPSTSLSPSSFRKFVKCEQLTIAAAQ